MLPGAPSTPKTARMPSRRAPSQPSPASTRPTDGDDAGDRSACRRRRRADGDDAVRAGSASLTKPGSSAVDGVPRCPASSSGLAPQHEAEDGEGQRDGREDGEEGEVADAAGEHVAADVAVARPGAPRPGAPGAGRRPSRCRAVSHVSVPVSGGPKRRRARRARRRRRRARRGGTRRTSKRARRSRRARSKARSSAVVGDVVGDRHVRVVVEVEVARAAGRRAPPARAARTRRCPPATWTNTTGETGRNVPVPAQHHAERTAGRGDRLQVRHDHRRGRRAAPRSAAAA